MFLSSHEIARSREHALNNILALSTACLDASQSFSELFSSSSREAFQSGGSHWAYLGDGKIGDMNPMPATTLLENAARVGRMLDGTLKIIGETHKAMIRSAESGIRVVDEVVFATINRATKSCPWEAELPLRLMKAGLQSAEHGLHDISSAAIETVTQTEEKIHQATETITASKPAPRKRVVARQKTA